MAVEFDVFLSHNSSDKPAVEEIGRRLEREGIRCWLDKWNLVPGEPWQEAIEEALQRSGACAVFLGPSGIGPWANEEMRVALTRRVAERRSGPGGRPGFRVLPVLLPGAPADVEVPPFLGRLTWVRFGSSLDDEDAFHRLIRGIRGMAPGARAEFDPILEAPYRGLEVFDVNHAPLFFGREEWIERLLRKVEESKRRFLAIVGPSGSGKSSLARAGVLAALQQGRIEGSSDWLQVICRPGAEPLLNLALALNRERSGADSYPGVRSLARDLVDDSSSLHVAARLALREAPEGSRLVLLIDQFEEIFTNRVEEEERRALLDSLYHAATVKDGPTLVIITLRAEFYGQFADHPIAELLSEHHVLLGPMTPDEFRRAIEMPALRAGCELEPGLTDLLLRDVDGQPGSLPLLQYALLELWEQRRGRRLVVETYRDIGGVAGALRRRAEQVQETFSAEEREVICRRLLLLLAQPDEREGYSRRRARRDEVLAVVGDHAQAETVLNKLADARLVVTESTEGESFVEIAHEALIREWPRLRGWIDERREELLLRSELGEAAERWNDKARDISYLFTGARLAAAEERSGEMGLGALEKEFLEASLATQQEEHHRKLAQAEALRQEQERRVNEEKRRRKLVLLAGIVAVLAAVLGTSWFFAQRQVRVQEVLARARNLSAQSGIALSSFPERGLLLAREAIRLAEEARQPRFPPAEEALHRALALEWGYPFQGVGSSRSAMSPDSRILATVSEDGKVQIWKTEQLGTSTNRPHVLSPGPPKKLMDLVISPGNHWLAGLYEDNRVYVWDLRKEQASVKPSYRQLTGQAEVVFHSQTSLAFSPEGNWLAIRSPGEPILLWRPESPQKVRQLGDRSTEIIAADFSNEDRLAIGYADGRIEVWDLTVHRQTPPIRLSAAEPGQLGGLVFRKAEAGALWLIASDKNGPMIAWDSQGKIAAPLRLAGCDDIRIRGSVSHLTISPRFRWLAYRNNDRKLCVFDLEAPSKPPMLEVPEIQGIAFQADDTHLAIADRANTVTLWDLTQSNPTSFRVFNNLSEPWDDPVIHLAFSPQGEKLVASSGRKLWLYEDTNGISISGWEPGHQGFPEIAGFSAGGRWLITTGFQDAPRAWDLSIRTDRAEPRTLGAKGWLLGQPNRSWGVGGRWLLANHELFDLQESDLSKRSSGRRARKRALQSSVTALSPNGEWVVYGGAETIVRRLIPSKTSPWGPEIARFNYTEAPSALAVSLDASRLAIAVAGSIEIRDMKGAEHRILASQRHEATREMAFSPDGRWLVASGANLSAWDLTDMDRKPFNLASLGEASRPTLHFSFPPDQRLLAFSKSQEVVHLYSLPNRGQPKQTMAWSNITAASLSEDGRWLATANSGDISLHDLRNSAAPSRILVGHLGEVNALVFSPGAHSLASAGQDGTVRLWDLGNPETLAPGTILAENSLGIEWLGFRSTFLFGSGDFRVLRWDLRMHCLKALACRVAGRSLTREEWRATTGLDEPPPDTCSQPLAKEEAAECADVLAPYGG